MAAVLHTRICFPDSKPGKQGTAAGAAEETGRSVTCRKDAAGVEYKNEAKGVDVTLYFGGGALLRVLPDDRPGQVGQSFLSGVGGSGPVLRVPGMCDTI